MLLASVTGRLNQPSGWVGIGMAKKLFDVDSS